MNHRNRLRACISGEWIDRPPVALWRHFPVDDQTPEGMAGATVEFQQQYDFDLIKVTPASSFCLKDWGAGDVWQGNTEGTREYTKRVIHSAEDWTSLPVLDPTQGYLGEQLKALNLIRQALPETPIIQTIFNPLSQAKNLVGPAELILHLRREPAALLDGLRVITESTMRFVEAAMQTGIEGVFYAVQHAQFELLTDEEYAEFGKPFDLEILALAEKLWLNLLHLHGREVMFDLFLDYPVAVINWHDRETGPSLSAAQERFDGAVCGGLRQWETMVLGTPEQVLSEAKEAINTTNGERMILGTGCVTPIVAPRANLLAARKAVEN